MGKYQSGSTPVSPISESLAPRSSPKKSNNSKKEGQFRSNLSSLFNLFKEIKNFVNEEHHKILKKTPFYHFFCAFLDNKVNVDKIKKSNVELRNLIKRYQPSKQSFLLGQTCVPLRVNDIGLIFGIVSGDVAVNLACGKISDAAFIERSGLKGDRRTNAFLRSQIIKSVKGNNAADIEDFVRLLCVYALNTVFFSAKDEIRPFLFPLVEDLDKMKSYAWAASIHKHLMLSLKMNHKTPKKLQGCVIVLQYWLCEHTNLIEPSGEYRFPRFLKWNLPAIIPFFGNIEYDNITEKQVREMDLDPTVKEILHLNVKYACEDYEMLSIETTINSDNPEMPTVNTTPLVEEISDTSTIPSVEQMNDIPTTPSVEQINDTSAMLSDEPINDASTTPLTEQINDISTLVHENETLKQQHKADMKRIEDLTSKHKEEMKRNEELTSKHKEIIAQVQHLNDLVASLTEYYSN